VQIAFELSGRECFGCNVVTSSRQFLLLLDIAQCFVNGTKRWSSIRETVAAHPLPKRRFTRLPGVSSFEMTDIVSGVVKLQIATATHPPNCEGIRQR